MASTFEVFSTMHCSLKLGDETRVTQVTEVQCPFNLMIGDEQRRGVSRWHGDDPGGGGLNQEHAF